MNDPQQEKEIRDLLISYYYKVDLLEDEHGDLDSFHSKKFAIEQAEVYVKKILSVLASHEKEVVEEIEAMKMKEGFMPLGFSEDPYNKTLDAVLSKLTKLQ